MTEPDERPTQNRPLTRARQRAFLVAFRTTGTIAATAKKAGVGRRTVYDWMAHDAAFKAKFDSADSDFCDAVEDEMIRRGLGGVDKPVFYKGVEVATVKEYSNDLLMFVAKARMPEKYKERRELTGAGGEPLIPTDVSEQVSRWLRKVAGQQESTSGHQAELGATIVEPAGAES